MILIVGFVAGRVQVIRVQDQAVRFVVVERRPTPIAAARAGIVCDSAKEGTGVKEIIGESAEAITYNTTSDCFSLVAAYTTIALRENTKVFGSGATGW